MGCRFGLRSTSTGSLHAGLRRSRCILFAELCPCPWSVLWYDVLAIPVHHCSVLCLCLWPILCLWWGGCLTVVGCRLCRRRSHVWFCLRGGGGLLGHVSVVVLEGRDRARDFRAVGVAVEPQCFCHRCRNGGAGVGVDIRGHAGGPAGHRGACRCSRNSACALVVAQARPVAAGFGRGVGLRVRLCWCVVVTWLRVPRFAVVAGLIGRFLPQSPQRTSLPAGPALYYSLGTAGKVPAELGLALRTHLREHHGDPVLLAPHGLATDPPQVLAPEVKPGIWFHDLPALATPRSTVAAVDAGTTQAGMAMAGVTQIRLEAYRTHVASGVGSSQEGEGMILLSYVCRLAQQPGVFWLVPNSEAAVGALRTYQEGGRCGDGIHHLSATVLGGQCLSPTLAINVVTTPSH